MVRYTDLVEFTFTIYNPGAQIYEHRTYKYEEHDHSGMLTYIDPMDRGEFSHYSIEEHTMLVVPDEFHYTGWVYEYEPEAVYYDDIIVERSKGQYANPDCFLKTWAVGIDVNHVASGYVTAKYGDTSLEFECSNMGVRTVYAPYVEDLFDLLDKYLETLPCKFYITDKEPEKEVHVIRMLTAWHYRTFQSNHPLDTVEWDSEWYLLGEITPDDINDIMNSKIHSESN